MDDKASQHTAAVAQPKRSCCTCMSVQLCWVLNGSSSSSSSSCKSRTCMTGSWTMSDSSTKGRVWKLQVHCAQHWWAGKSIWTWTYITLSTKGFGERPQRYEMSAMLTEIFYWIFPLVFSIPWLAIKIVALMLSPHAFMPWHVLHCRFSVKNGCNGGHPPLLKSH